MRMKTSASRAELIEKYKKLAQLAEGRSLKALRMAQEYRDTIHLLMKGAK